LRLFENKVEEDIWAKEKRINRRMMEVPHEDLHYLNSLQNIIRVNTSWKISCADHVACKWKMRNKSET
jgi:hypothetical protein